MGEPRLHKLDPQGQQVSAAACTGEAGQRSHKPANTGKGTDDSPDSLFDTLFDDIVPNAPRQSQLVCTCSHVAPRSAVL